MTPPKIVGAWQIANWLTGHRWSDERGKVRLSREIEPLRLKPQARSRVHVLAHWLTYITNIQRPWEECWRFGGPIFVEIAHSFIKERWKAEKILEQLARWMSAPDKGLMWSFTTRRRKEQTCYTIRFPVDLHRLAHTVYTLARAETYSIQEWLEAEQWFWADREDSVGRMAYLLYLLTYHHATQSVTTIAGDKRPIHSLSGKVRPALLRALDEYWEQIIEWLHTDHDDVERVYRGKWSALPNGGRFSQKRLWATTRDYIRADFGGFRAGFRQPERVPTVADHHALEQLEFPGDVWNERFAEKVLGWSPEDRVSPPAFLRQAWKAHHQQLLDGFSPEDFDVSFDFTPRMCGRWLEQVCPFKDNGRQLCPVLAGAKVQDQYCPVVATSCGYVSKCDPANCPVLEGAKELGQFNVCEGCEPTP